MKINLLPCLVLLIFISCNKQTKDHSPTTDSISVETQDKTAELTKK